MSAIQNSFFKYALWTDHDMLQIKVRIRYAFRNFPLEARGTFMSLADMVSTDDFINAVGGQSRHEAWNFARILCDRMPRPELPSFSVLTLVYGALKLPEYIVLTHANTPILVG